MGLVSSVTAVQREHIGKCASGHGDTCVHVLVSLSLVKGPLCSKADDCFDSQWDVSLSWRSWGSHWSNKWQIQKLPRSNKWETMSPILLLGLHTSLAGGRCASTKVCAQMRLLACVNLCSVADEAKQVFITMLPWLDSDQTRWHYCLSFLLRLW